MARRVRGGGAKRMLSQRETYGFIMQKVRFGRAKPYLLYCVDTQMVVAVVALRLLLGLAEGSMGFKPVFAPARIGYERHGKRIGVLHLLHNDFLHFFFLFGIDGEVKLIMHLENHL